MQSVCWIKCMNSRSFTLPMCWTLSLSKKSSWPRISQELESQWVTCSHFVHLQKRLIIGGFQWSSIILCHLSILNAISRTLTSDWAHQGPHSSLTTVEGLYQAKFIVFKNTRPQLPCMFAFGGQYSMRPVCNTSISSSKLQSWSFTMASPWLRQAVL